MKFINLLSIYNSANTYGDIPSFLAVFLLLNSSVFLSAILLVSLFWVTFSSLRTIYRGTQWICSSKYPFFREIFAGPGDLEKMSCPWKERVAGK